VKKLKELQGLMFLNPNIMSQTNFTSWNATKWIQSLSYTLDFESENASQITTSLENSLQLSSRCYTTYAASFSHHMCIWEIHLMQQCCGDNNCLQASDIDYAEY